MTTHQPEEAERCHRIAILDRGQLVVAGTPDELRGQVAGDVLRIEAERCDEIARDIEGRLGLKARVMEGGGSLSLEAPRGHELVPRVVELFSPGRLRSVATARPA